MKVAKRLYGLRLLKGNALPADVLISVTVRISDLLLNMLVRCGITTFRPVLQRSVGEHPKESTQIIFSGIAYAECLLNAKLSTFCERRTVLCNWVFSNMMLLTHKTNWTT
jgi:hypothetical protein